jgi:hypothetical protein
MALYKQKEYRQRAREMRRQADLAQTEKLRAAYLAIADKWELLAAAPAPEPAPEPEGDGA